MVTEEQEAGWSCVLCHYIRYEFIAALVNWDDFASFEFVADVVHEESDVSAFRRDEGCLYKFDCRLVISEKLRGCSRFEAKVSVKVSEVDHWFCDARHGGVFCFGGA